VNLTEWARRQGIHPQTAYNWFHAGTLPVPAVRINKRTILVQPDAALGTPGETIGLYARVSSHDQRGDLDRQVARLTTWAATTGLPVVRVEAEVGSGMNGSRSKLRRLLADPTVTTVVVEHRDRLARMNAELVEAALSAHGRRLVVLDDGEMDDDLVRDMTEVLTSFCARLYGRRSARNRAEKALRCAAHDVGPMALAKEATVNTATTPRVPHPTGTTRP
jgi:putative resolvase